MQSIFYFNNKDILLMENHWEHLLGITQQL